MMTAMKLAILSMTWLIGVIIFFHMNSDSDGIIYLRKSKKRIGFNEGTE